MHTQMQPIALLLLALLYYPSYRVARTPGFSDSVPHTGTSHWPPMAPICTKKTHRNLACSPQPHNG
ncbi:hypothetical protein BC940DRAFT_311801 [Gongronella butleri]|nr:hypothetical protein BC940DRAFT_311801 [Gongronella butleri]